MNLNLDIPQPLADVLKSNAESCGLDVATYVVQALQAIAPAKSDRSDRSGLTKAEFLKGLQEFVEKHPQCAGPIDDSRESIYAGRGE